MEKSAQPNYIQLTPYTRLVMARSYSEEVQVLQAVMDANPVWAMAVAEEAVRRGIADILPHCRTLKHQHGSEWHRPHDEIALRDWGMHMHGGKTDLDHRAATRAGSAR